MAVFASATVVVTITSVTARMPVSENYSYWLFLGLPFLQGLISSVCLEVSGPVRFGRHVVANLLALSLLGIVLLILAYEGLICFAMAFPLVFVASLAGSGLGCSLMTLSHGRKGPAAVSLFVVAPVFLMADSLTAGKPTMRVQSSEVVINATAEQIWPYLSNLGSVKTDFWMFGVGVAYPVRVSTPEPFLGGKRECVLSTGVMHETITEWIPNRRLAFEVLNTPPSMREMNPFGEVHAPHLQGWFESLEGSFTLVPLSDGRTKLVGASRFQHKFRPVSYWNMWTDKIVREIQLSVLREIKARAEKGSLR